MAQAVDVSRRRYDPDSVDAHLRELELDDDDRALLEHVLGDDRPPQGLHRQGWRDPELELWEATLGDGLEDA